MAKNAEFQRELFEITQIEAITKASYYASNKLDIHEKTLNYLSLLKDDMKSNITVWRNLLSVNGLLLSKAPDEIRDKLSLALIAINNNKNSYEFVSDNLKQNKHLILALIKLDPYYAFLEAPDSCLKQKKISSMLFSEILKSKNIGNRHHTQPILKRIFSNNLKDSMISQSACYKVISKFISSKGDNFLKLPNEFKKDESLILKAISAETYPCRNLHIKLPKDFVVSDSLYLKMIRAGYGFKILPSRLKSEAKFYKAGLKNEISIYSLFKVDLWKNRDLSIIFLKHPQRHFLQNPHGYFKKNPFNKIAKIIEKFHKADEEIIYLLVKNGFIIEDDSKFIDNKKIVLVLLKNMASYYWNNHRKVFKRYESLSPCLKKDKEIASLVLKMNFSAIYPKIDNSLKLDLLLMKSVVNQKSSCFEHFPESLKNNKEIAKIAIRRNGNCYKHVSKRLKNDIEIINLALDKKPTLFKLFPKAMRDDFRVASKAIQEDSSLMASVGDKMRENKIFMRKALMYGASLRYASSELKKDKDIVKLATSQQDSNLYYAHSDIKKDKEFLLNNFSIDLVFIYCSKKILQDSQIFIKGLNFDWRLIEDRKMTSGEILKMNFEGIDFSQRLAIFSSFKKKNNLKDIFLIANAKSIICGI
jgi:hypothetical protein